MDNTRYIVSKRLRREMRRNGMAQKFCSFCGRSSDKVEKLIAGPGNVYICNECVELFHDILQSDQKLKPVATTKDKRDIPTPSQIKSELDKYVIGQERVKKSSLLLCTIITRECFLVKMQTMWRSKSRI